MGDSRPHDAARLIAPPAACADGVVLSGMALDGSVGDVESWWVNWELEVSLAHASGFLGFPGF